MAHLLLDPEDPWRIVQQKYPDALVTHLEEKEELYRLFEWCDDEIKAREEHKQYVKQRLLRSSGPYPPLEYVNFGRQVRVQARAQAINLAERKQVSEHKEVSEHRQVKPKHKQPNCNILDIEKLANFRRKVLEATLESLTAEQKDRAYLMRKARIMLKQIQRR